MQKRFEGIEPISGLRTKVIGILIDPDRFWLIEEVHNIELDESDVRVQERNYKKFQGSTRGGGID